MATKPPGKEFRSGTIGELADDVYAEINAINADAASWAAIVAAAAAADSAIDFNSQNITGATIPAIQAGVGVAPVADNSGGVVDGALDAVGDTSMGDESGAINNNFADLAAKIEEIRAVLVAAGILS